MPDAPDARLDVLPRGRHAAPRHVVEQSQRGRLLEAMAAVVGEQGYVNTSVADVLTRAGISRKTFYEYFANRQECFLQAYDEVSTSLLNDIEEAIAAEPDPLRATLAGSRTYLEWIAGHPEFARAFFIEVLAAGPDALALRAAVHGRFAKLLESGYARVRAAVPGLPENVPAHRFTAVVGGVNELVLEELRSGRAIDVEALLPKVTDIQVTLMSTGAA